MQIYLKVHLSELSSASGQEYLVNNSMVLIPTTGFQVFYFILFYSLSSYQKYMKISMIG